MDQHRSTPSFWLPRVLAWGWWVLFSFGGFIFAPEEPSDPTLWAIVNVVAGLAILILLRWRHRRPMLIAVLSITLLLFTISGWVAALWALASLGTTRNWRRIGVASVITLVITAGWAYVTVTQDRVEIEGLDGGPLWVFYLVAVMIWLVPLIIALGMGIYVGARRELVASLRERAELADERRHFEVESARSGERNRIAREMHDVVAHRISLISMQASAMNFRDDLSPAETKELSGQIQANAKQALDELRSVLGSLRNVDETGAVAKPQPTLAQLPALIADAREAGQKVEATVDVDVDALPQKLSRHAFRVVQEGLTNARKHAAGTLVTLTVDEHNNGLRVVMTNPLRVGASTLPGSGQGLVGLEERVQMAGGSFAAGIVGEEFKLRSWMPWPSEF